jgi:hypothetical protein
MSAVDAAYDAALGHVEWGMAHPRHAVDARAALTGVHCADLDVARYAIQRAKETHTERRTDVIICDGCGEAIPSDEPESLRRIVVTDYYGTTTGIVHDLCAECRPRVKKALIDAETAHRQRGARDLRENLEAILARLKDGRP